MVCVFYSLFRAIRIALENFDHISLPRTLLLFFIKKNSTVHSQTPGLRRVLDSTYSRYWDILITPDWRPSQLDILPMNQVYSHSPKNLINQKPLLV